MDEKACEMFALHEVIDEDFICAIQQDAWLAGGQHQHIIQQKDALKSAGQREIPDGWQLVPKEPTFEMAAASDQQFKKFNGMIGTYQSHARRCPRKRIKIGKLLSRRSELHIA